MANLQEQKPLAIERQVIPPHPPGVVGDLRSLVDKYKYRKDELFQMRRDIDSRLVEVDKAYNDVLDILEKIDKEGKR